MFGSFGAERDDEPVSYGIVKQLGSFNILWAAVHEWVGIAKDVWAAPWKHKLSYMWREPGWRHDGRRATSAPIKDRWAAGRAGGEQGEYQSTGAGGSVGECKGSIGYCGGRGD